MLHKGPAPYLLLVTRKAGRSAWPTHEEGLGLGLEPPGLWGHQPASLWPALARFRSVFGRSQSRPELDFPGLLLVRVAENSTQLARAGSREGTPLQESHRCQRKARPAVQPGLKVANLSAKCKVGAKKVLTWSWCKTINSQFVRGQDPLNQLPQSVVSVAPFTLSPLLSGAPLAFSHAVTF